MLRCLKAELVEEKEDGCVGAVGVFLMLLMCVLEDVLDWPRC